jgi:hypothetical protein
MTGVPQFTQTRVRSIVFADSPYTVQTAYNRIEADTIG